MISRSTTEIPRRTNTTILWLKSSSTTGTSGGGGCVIGSEVAPVLFCVQVKLRLIIHSSKEC